MASPDDISAPDGKIADSVRLALATESRAIAEIQRRAWSAQLPPETVEAMLAQVSTDEMAEVWEHAIQRPPQAQFRVMAAVAERRVVGFATTVPSADPDADPSRDGLIDEFAIDPTAQRRGHGSRLLNACVDTLRADGFTRATWWVQATDDVTRAFLTEAGWEADGSFREIGTEDEASRIKQVRLHTDIRDPSDSDKSEVRGW